MDIIKEKWEEILYTVKLEHELTDVSFDTWLKPLKVHSFEKNGSANTLYILIPAEQQPAFGYIKKKYALPLRVAIAEITGLDCSLEFILPEEAQKLEAKKATVTSNRYLRGRQQQQFCPRRIPRGGRISGRNVQSSLYLRRRWSGKNPPHAFHRAFYIRKKSGNQGALCDQ